MNNTDATKRNPAHPSGTPPRKTRAARLWAALSSQTTGGLLMVLATTVALIWANSPWAQSYFDLRDLHVGLGGLNLTLGDWAADGLLAIFFFLVGLELKQEIIAGDLRNPKTAALPIMAAVGGVAVPALIFVVLVGPGPLALGWAIPTATDITFAVAILSIVGAGLPSSLRLFLLTLAVVDDLIAVVIIAVFYTDQIDFAALAASLAVLAIYWLVAHRYQDLFGMRPFAAWVVLFPIGLLSWAFMYDSGVHATIAGVALGLCIPVRKGRRVRQAWGMGSSGLAGEFERRFRPLSNLVSVPVFGLFAAGIAFGGWGGLVEALSSPVAIAVMVALVAGKPIGILAGTLIGVHATPSTLPKGASWMDVAGIAVLGGVGFTVALLVAELSFPSASVESEHAKIAVLCASLVAALLAVVILVPRARKHGRRT